jgi:hypothetical protein
LPTDKTFNRETHKLLTNYTDVYIYKSETKFKILKNITVLP